MNAVYGWARMLQMGQIDEAAMPRAFESIVRNSHVQLQLIDDLLDMSRIMSGKMRLDIRPVDLPRVLESALDAIRPAAEAKAKTEEYVARRTALSEQKIKAAETDAVNAVRAAAVDLAVAAAEKLIASKVDAATDATLFNNSVNEVKTRLN